jgi:integrase
MSKNSPFTDIITEFIALKTASGYKYLEESRALRKFDSFLTEQGLREMEISREAMDTWCIQGFRESRKSLSNRVAVIRQLAIYIANKGYNAAVPDIVKNAKNELFIPYVFSHEEVHRIFNVVDNLPAGRHSNSHIVYPILFRLLYGCGLRIGEALALKIQDVDLKSGVLTIKHAKNDKMRLVPMSESLQQLCRGYSSECLSGFSHDEYFLRKKYGGSRKRGTVGQAFRTILWRSGIPYCGKGKGPRLHDVRHTFCCHSLKQMSDNGIDLYCSLPVLSTYLGHSSIKSTEKYLRLTMEIYPEIAGRMELSTCDIYPEVLFDDQTN